MLTPQHHSSSKTQAILDTQIDKANEESMKGTFFNDIEDSPRRILHLLIQALLSFDDVARAAMGRAAARARGRYSRPRTLLHYPCAQPNVWHGTS